jgi:hypothetical protein
MKLGPVHFGHLSYEELNDVYLCARTLAVDVRVCNCYGLSNLIKAFVREANAELARRELEARLVKQDQLQLDPPPAA